MSIAVTIRERRSIRQFNDKPIATELLLQLLNDAVWAPNHGLREPWRFIAAERMEAKARLVDLMMESMSHLKRLKLMPGKMKQMMSQHYSKTPAFLIVVMKADKDAHKQEEDFAAVSCLIQNFQLLAWEQGIGMVWSTLECIHSPIFCEGLGVKPGERIVGILHMGYYDKIPKAKTRTPAEKKLTVL
ncbi:nitroreductase [Paenibacillus algorifonticola]|uniref:nitroreductase family protein n=1 Tax=Paenibacillus algorifonticola TaxID=684063 RepID=UPI003D2942C9